jgi:hypothetical protein
MPDITLPTGQKLRSEDVAKALFHAKGTAVLLKAIPGPSDKRRDDELEIVMKDGATETKFNSTFGEHARRIADELEAFGVPVSRDVLK